MENLDPTSPQIKDGKMARFCPSRGFILDLGGWGFAVPFYFVQDCSSLLILPLPPSPPPPPNLRALSKIVQVILKVK